MPAGWISTASKNLHGIVFLFFCSITLVALISAQTSSPLDAKVFCSFRGYDGGEDIAVANIDLYLSHKRVFLKIDDFSLMIFLVLSFIAVSP